MGKKYDNVGWSLERISPALYGWLVWGGGYYAILQGLKILAVITFLAGIFFLGDYVL